VPATLSRGVALALASCSIAAGLAPAGAQAQERADSRDAAENRATEGPAADIVVTGFRAEEQGSATKTALSIRETPQSISVTTRESMDARQVRDLTSALELTAGLTSGIAADRSRAAASAVARASCCAARSSTAGATCGWTASWWQAACSTWPHSSASRS
jgi:outer membrane receptor for ferric coprogen and ferric-rhodotorulic acid